MILGLVAVFVLVVAGTMVARTRTVEVQPVDPATRGADLAIKDVEISEEAGDVRWWLKARRAMIFDAEQRTTLRDVAVRVQEPGRTWTIVGEEGEVTERRTRIEVRGHVVVTSDDGLRLETSVLRWDGRQHRIWTDAPVTMRRDRVQVRGTALDVRVGQDHTTVGGRVRATFRPGRG